MRIRMLMLLGLFALPVQAFMVTGTNSALMFTREDVIIEPQQATATSLDDVQVPRMPARYMLEMRGERALQLEEMHSLTQLSAQTGVLIGFSAPTVISLPRFAVNTPLDVLYVDETGSIVQMLPGHIPAEATGNLMAETPIKAWIYLQNGQIAARDLKPRDRVRASLFTPPPPMIR